MYIVVSFSRLSLIVVLTLTLTLVGYHSSSSSAAAAAAAADANTLELQSSNDKGGPPTINDPHLKVDLVFKGLQFPTSMAFLGPNDILVLEKNNGTVQRIVNGHILPHPLLKVPVANKGETGMLGIAVAEHKNDNRPTYVFLYYTVSGGEKASGNSTTTNTIGGGSIQPLGNRLYKYEFVNNSSNDKLIIPKLLLTIPTSPKTPNHNGGKIIIGPDQNVYIVIGDTDEFYDQYFNHLSLTTKAQNFKNGSGPNGTGGILRLTQDGKPVGKNIILSDKFPLDLYYAYGIRNSFGMDFDPVIKKLWDTENGPAYGDEINLVEPGFNSGWAKVQGVWENNESRKAGPIMLSPDPHILVDFGGRGKYRPPELTWNVTVAPTGLAFVNSSKMGKQYENDMFVGDYLNGNLYHFKLKKNRTGLDLHGPLADTIISNPSEMQQVIFGHGFGRITDIKVGPDGYIYILSVNPTAAGKEGTIFRISPANVIMQLIPPFFIY
jgi:glucose/arabinose dehydrogenase